MVVLVLLTAEYVKHNLFSNLIKHPKFISDTKSAIGFDILRICVVDVVEKAFLVLLFIILHRPLFVLAAETYSHTDSEFLKSENNQNRDDGSTAFTAILVGDRLLVANVGDSRAVICRGGEGKNCKNVKTSLSRLSFLVVDVSGHYLYNCWTWRVGGVRAVSRAFGDKLLKQYVDADPEIQEEKVDSSLELLILASDGLWDVVTNEEAVAMVKPMEDAEEAAKKLMQEAYQRGSADNITCVVVRILGNPATSLSRVSDNHVDSSNRKSGGHGDPPSQVTGNQGSSKLYCRHLHLHPL
ncbi:putative protein phosphatase 2C 59 [Silene latifolia]|uniref:putative protein phosphatase 2C 59 n=1 Tax=Silene latifolia TaxID=37657 RepID=UPI003D772590